MTQWNPNAPEIIGCEWRPYSPDSAGASDWMLSDGIAYVQRARSLSAETITAFEVYCRSVFGTANLMLEVYEAGNEVPGAVTTLVLRPTGDDTVTAVVGSGGGALYQYVDEATVNYADYITQSGAASAGIYSAVFSGTAGWPAGRRIVDISMTYLVAATTSTSQQVTCHLLDGTGNDLIVRQDFYAQTQGVRTLTASIGPDNPFTGLPWSQTDVAAFASAAADLELALVFEDQGGGQPDFRLYQLWMTVTYCDENRVAVASSNVPADGVFAARSFSNVRKPDTGVANWSKATNTTYSYLLRRSPPRQTVGTLLRSSGWFAFPWLDSSSVAPMQTVDTAESFTASLTGSWRVSSLGTATTRLRGIAPQKAGPVYSESTQPFVTLTTQELYSAILPGPIIFTQYGQQKITTTGAKTFARLKMLLRPYNEETDDLHVYLFTAVNGGGVEKFHEVITPAEVLASEQLGTDAEPWYLLDRLLTTPVALAAATDYWLYVGGEIGNLSWGTWYLLLMDTWTAGVGSYLDATDTAYDLSAGTADVSADYGWTIETIPTPPSDFAVGVTPIALPGDGSNCSIDEYDGVSMTWTASADALVDTIEIQRYDTQTDSWDTIDNAPNDDEAAIDIDPQQNVENCYRARFVRSTGEASEWCDAVCATPTFDACGLILVPWDDAARALAYTWPTSHEFQFLDADRRVTYPIYGRDGQVAFYPTETLGDQFVAPLVLNVAQTPTPAAGRWVFDDLVRIARDGTLPYVSVLDETGRRWYASLACAKGTRTEPQMLYVADLTVTTTSLTPTVRP